MCFTVALHMVSLVHYENRVTKAKQIDVSAYL